MLGDDIKACGSGQWSFGGSVPGVFEQHIEKSLPGYRLAHDLVAELSVDFVGKDSLVVDLGCSTGVYASELGARLPDTSFRYFGLDVEPEMIKHCVDRFLGERFEFCVLDALEAEYLGVDLYVSMFTLQFIRPKDRMRLLNRIYESLNWGGGFLVFEKIRGSDARFNDLLTDWYYSFKRKNGYTNEEIALKRDSLRHLMEPFSSAGNETIFKEAGFVDICSIFQVGPFKGWLCIK